MADAPAVVSTDRADRVADALQEREADMLLVTDLDQRPLADGLHRQQRGRGRRARGQPALRDRLPLPDAVGRAGRPRLGARDRRRPAGRRGRRACPAPGDLRLAFDDAHMSVKDHGRLAGMLRAGIELVPAGGAIEALRAVKDADELEAIRAAARLADDALTEVLGRGLVGRTERDVALDLEFTMRRMGAQAASFPPIVAAGEHGALPHADAARRGDPGRHAGRRRLGRAARRLRLGLHAHLRHGRASTRATARSTSSCSSAQEAALAAVRPGPTGREVDAVARAIIDAAGHAEHFGHGLGHGVGLDVHEGPRLSKQGDDRAGGRHGRHRRARGLRAGRRRRAHRGPRDRHRRRRRGRLLAAQGAAGRRLTDSAARRLKIPDERPMHRLMNGGRPVRVLLALLVGWTVLREAEVGPLRPLMHGPLFGKLAYWIVIVGASLLTLWRAQLDARTRGPRLGPHRHSARCCGPAATSTGRSSSPTTPSSPCRRSPTPATWPSTRSSSPACACSCARGSRARRRRCGSTG